MINNVKISVRQFTVLVTFFTIGTTIFAVQSSLAADAKQDAWIAALLGIVMELLLVCFYNIISKQFPNMTLVDMNEKVFGKWIGKLISLSFVFFSFIGASTVLYYVGNFITTQIMPETPILAINILFAGIVIMGLRLGLETIARSAELLFPIFLLLYFMFAVSLFPQVEFDKLQPLFEDGIKPIFKGAITFMGTATFPMIVLFMVFPAYINDAKAARKAFLIASLLGGMILFTTIFLSISVLGTTLSERTLFPSYVLAKKIDIGKFFQRVEVIMGGMWLMSIFFKATFYFYGFVTGLAQIFEIKNYRPLVLPCGLIWVAYSLVIYPNLGYMSKFDNTVFIPYSITFGLFLPLIILGVGLIRRKSAGMKP